MDASTIVALVFGAITTIGSGIGGLVWCLMKLQEIKSETAAIKTEIAVLKERQTNDRRTIEKLLNFVEAKL